MSTWPLAGVGPETFEVPTLCAVYTRQFTFGYQATRGTIHSLKWFLHSVAPDLPSTVEVTEGNVEEQDHMVLLYLNSLRQHVIHFCDTPTTNHRIEGADWVVTIPCVWTTEPLRSVQQRFVHLAEKALHTTVHVTTEIQAAANAYLSEVHVRDCIMDGSETCVVFFCDCGGSTFVRILLPLIC